MDILTPNSSRAWATQHHRASLRNSALSMSWLSLDRTAIQRDRGGGFDEEFLGEGN